MFVLLRGWRAVGDGFNWIFARHGVFIFLPVPGGTVWWTAQVSAAGPPADPAAVGVAELSRLFGTEPQATAVLRAAIAMEDAVVLARHLAGTEAGTIPRALAAFDRERQPRAGKLAKMEASNRDAKTAGPIGTRMREMIMPYVFSRFYERATGWLYDFDPGTLPVTPRR